MPCYFEQTEHNYGSSYSAPTYAASSESPIATPLASYYPTESAAARGTRIHATIAAAERVAVAADPTPSRSGWSIFTNAVGQPVIERAAGGERRIDAAYVNHSQKALLVVDYFTGRGQEPVSHARKGWQYANEPDVKKLVDQGYTFRYQSANPNKPH